ncbi:carbohydrate sulfotransferase 15-like [Haliotis cracherodii]|uniref:carbohydrate sulfotransferase 15-like n=1 Tax=Haliotis cracherodii TaxID=6455 RepID=UPI0039ECE8A0
MDMRKVVLSRVTLGLLCLCQGLVVMGIWLSVHERSFQTSRIQGELLRQGVRHPLVYDSRHSTWSSGGEGYGTGPGNTSVRCRGRRHLWQAEDIFCLRRLSFLKEYKNPCFHERTRNGRMNVLCLPYFHLLGVDKCGTTDLFDRILAHPEVAAHDGVSGKEMFYWSMHRYGFGIRAWNVDSKETVESYIYRMKKAKEVIRKTTTNGYHDHIFGDGTPLDFWDFRGWTNIPQNEGLEEPEVLTPHLMRHLYRDPKFIILLRNPTERLYSDYIFMGDGLTPDTFHKHSTEALELLETCFRNRSVRWCLFDRQLNLALPTRLHVGCYAVFLKEWLSVFHKQSFLILRTEDYKMNIKEHLYKVFNFLNVTKLSDDDITEIAEHERKHVTKRKKTAGPMRTDTRVLLDRFYSKFNKQLAEILRETKYLWKEEA